MRNSRAKRNRKSTKAGLDAFLEFFQNIFRSRKSRIILGVVAAVIIVIIVVLAVNVQPPAPTPPVEPSDQTQQDETPDDPEDDYTGIELDVDGANRKEGFYTFLIAGTDQGGGNTDTIMVGAYDSINKKINIVSIPRDTLINVNWSVKKINAAYSRGGVDGLKKEISKIMGFVPDSYAIINLQAFEELVDAIDGVYYDVPVDMHYSDPTQNLVIDLDKGYQHLTGSEAIGVMRFRSGYSDADIGRINTQQDFLMTLADQVLSVGNVTKIKEIADIFSKHVETNMLWGNMVWYGTEFLKLEDGAIQFHQLPANTLATIRGGSYVSIYTNDWLKMVNEMLNPYTTDITTSNVNILTKDKNGLHSTTGNIAGGEDSFLNYYELTGRPDPEAQQPEDPTVDPNNPEGGEVTPPEGGEVTPPEGGEVTPPEGGEVTPPEGGETTDPGTELPPGEIPPDGVIDPNEEVWTSPSDLEVYEEPAA